MYSPSILIVTHCIDPHVDVVTARLEQLGHRVHRVNLDARPLEESVRFAWHSESAESWIGGAVTRISFDDIGAVWWRKPLPFTAPATLTADERDFVRIEGRHALQGLWASIDAYWMSHPEHLRRASCKPEQLRRAARLGLNVPRTLLTNVPEEAMEFCASCGGRMVFKPLAPPRFPSEQHSRATRSTLFSSVVDEATLRQLAPAVRTSPCLFQEYIEKDYELRVTVIAGAVFAAKIDSQSDPRTRLDWRRPGPPNLLSAARLPDDVAQRCVELVRSFNLEFSAIDLIVRPDGTTVFLESNPNGQWYFIEHAVPELRMADHLAKTLADRACAPRRSFADFEPLPAL